MDIDFIKDEKNWPVVKEALKRRDKDTLKIFGKYFYRAGRKTADVKALPKIYWIYLELEWVNQYRDDIQAVFYDAYGTTVEYIDGIESFKHFRRYLFKMIKVFTKQLIEKIKWEYARSIKTISIDQIQEELVVEWDCGDVSLEKLTRQLSEKSQIIFDLRNTEELAYKEIGFILDISPVNAKVTYYHNKEKLKKLVKQA